MIKNIPIVVLTGGPCGGKTTALVSIRDYLMKWGYKVILFQEIATELINAGYPPDKDPYTFQKLVLRRTISSLNDYVDHLDDKEKVVVLCDRLYLDGKAYCTPDEWQRACAEVGLDEHQMIEQVDLVIHMTSAALGAEEYYTKENNAARRENLEEAKVADHRTRTAWIAHPHFRIVDNQTDFKTKISRAIAHLARKLHLPMPKEIEEKFLIMSSRATIDNFLTKNKCESVQIVQTYLEPMHGEERRVRKMVRDGIATYTYTSKMPTEEVNVRVEKEKVISLKEYNTFLTEYDPELEPIVKDRYYVDHEGHRFELDLVRKPVEIAFIEVELADKDEKFTLPPGLEYKRVTGMREYSMNGIARGLLK